MIWFRKLIDRHFPDHAESRYEALIEKAKRQGYIDPHDNEELLSVKRTLALRGIQKK